MATHTLDEIPRFIMVGTKPSGKGDADRKQKYYGARKIYMCSALFNADILKNLSLIVPSFYTERPPMKNLIKMGKPVVNSDGNQAQVQDIDYFSHHVRYFGLVDLDMDMSAIACG